MRQSICTAQSAYIYVHEDCGALEGIKLRAGLIHI